MFVLASLGIELHDTCAALGRETQTGSETPPSDIKTLGDGNRLSGSCPRLTFGHRAGHRGEGVCFWHPLGQGRRGETRLHVELFCPA